MDPSTHRVGRCRAPAARPDPDPVPDSVPDPERGFTRLELGFTMLELVAVMSILAVLMGIGIGFLQRGQTDLDVAASILRDQVRLAATTAKSRAAPSEVLVQPTADGTYVRVQARVLASVGQWHGEPDERWVSEQEQPSARTDELDPAGRFGHAYRTSPGTAKPVLVVPTERRPVFGLRDGFVLRVDVKLAERSSGIVARMGRTFELRLDAEAVPQARVTLAEPGPRPGAMASVAGRRPLPLHRWVTLQLVYDRAFVRLYVDGAEVGATAASKTPFQEGRESFEVVPADGAFAGWIDEVRLSAYEMGEAVDLPRGVEASGLPDGVIAFGPGGEALGDYHFELVLHGERRTFRVRPGGVLE